ncbi:MAG: hypothetical protein ABSC94_08705 [Polyangiaceae bacterium]|jgi:hypothetical protein
MKNPPEVVGTLSPHEEKQVKDIISRAEGTLAHETEASFNVSETRATIPERVWAKVVAEAILAGWLADQQGAIVTIRRPSEGHHGSP